MKPRRLKCDKCGLYPVDYNALVWVVRVDGYLMKQLILCRGCSSKVEIQVLKPFHTTVDSDKKD